MVKPLGGRGNKAPYETVMVRVPLPIKSRVESLIADYRDSISDSNDAANTEQSNKDIEACAKLVYRFIAEYQLTEQLNSKTPRMYRLNQLVEWLGSQNSSESDTL